MADHHDGAGSTHLLKGKEVCFMGLCVCCFIFLLFLDIATNLYVSRALDKPLTTP